MFPKVALIFLAIGALSVNALSIPVAREPAPELEFQDVNARGGFGTLELEARAPVVPSSPNLLVEAANKPKHKSKHKSKSKPKHKSKREPSTEQ